MDNSVRVLLWSLLAAWLAAPVAAQTEEERLARLTPEHRAWVEEEVVYVITDAEREFFLTLETLEERQRFIEAFWRKRDPDPASPANEAEEEHYRRLAFANLSLADDTTRPGWMTDRGRMFILLGEPRERQRFDGLNEIVSTELWFYQSEPGVGLPSFFYLVFFRPRDIGEYRLYHPALDGPRSLLRGRYASLDTTDPAHIVVTLGDISPELGRASLSLDPSDPGDLISGRASLGTDILLDRIWEAPRRRIRTDYLDAARRYGDLVSADYSFNFVLNRSVFRMLLAPDASALVHYSVELDPQDMALQSDEATSRFYTILDLSVEVRDREGTLVHTEDRELVVDLSAAQMEAVQASPFAFQGSFPLVPGDFETSVILRNRVMTRFTVAETTVSVPESAPGVPVMSDPVLAFGVEPVVNGQPAAFTGGRHHFRPAADHLFALGDSLTAGVQLTRAGSGSTVRFTLGAGDEALRERVLPAGDFGDGGGYAEFDLTGLGTGTHWLRVELRDSQGAVTADRDGEFQLIPRTVPRASYVHRSGADVAEPGALALTRGNQFLALGRVEAARAELERAVAANPELPAARWRLASVYLRTENADRVLELLTPLEADHGSQYEVVAGLGFAHYFKQQFADAARYLERAASIRPAGAVLLNALGEAHEQSGDLEGAESAFERSLALEPDQQVIEERLARIRSKLP
ncbi:MAG: GWxTD domain-containing protein [Acidobacteria bacterium]|nr:GWxTD domain-containing protein [Acidobacteriota bacterium]MYA46253.1 GWxTD domain-containing protein [Acidobacteriota bacterium]MYI39903.1 GWxTD domain-containing protein [Acidobacteriota bacterium]